MKFLVDAQLPKAMIHWLAQAGHDAVHTRSLPDANASADEDIRLLADTEGRAVITKDYDFVESHRVQGTPQKLLHITLGNMDNKTLQSILVPLIPDFVREFRSHDYLEVDDTGVIIPT
jgi:predicted nuclease of predicted toxin-antitoxin system